MKNRLVQSNKIQNMKSIIKFSLVLLTITICFAFASKNNDGINATFGVSAEDPSQIELKLNKDYTFFYQDFSIPSEKIEVQGTYQIEKNKIQLMSESEEVDFHDQWKIVENGEAAKSRKGLTFYTLRKK